jgi:serine protease AprX
MMLGVHRAVWSLLMLGKFLVVSGQTSVDTWWVRFTDKTNTPYSIDAPEAYLSPRSIQRRLQQGIAIDELDLPVDPAYIQAVLDLGDVQLHNRSRWFNAITIRTSDTDVLDAILALPFVQDIRSTRSHAGRSPVQDKYTAVRVPEQRDKDYGDSFDQIAMMNGHLLHAMNAQGQGMLIGVLDSGFEGTDNIPAFGPLFERSGIVLTRDLVDHDDDVFLDHWHGRSVLSCMAAVVDGALVGTAPQADYALVRTENVASEYLVEEDDWISGAELCDSLGVDILNTSLGYTVFDDSTQNHVYDELDGGTLRISIAAGIASQKGMIPVISAGNQGNSDWYHISAPADAMDILAVGAVGAQGQHAWFSSHGPSADGRVKPDVAAMGWGTVGIAPDGSEITPLNGTSFSAPLVSGLVACLWQLHPDRSAQDIMDAVRRSASQYDQPDNRLGYGIPDMWQAHMILELTTPVSDVRESLPVVVYPVPFHDSFNVLATGELGDMALELCDMSGRVHWQGRYMPRRDPVRINDAGLMHLSPGTYILRINGRAARTVIKAP